MPSIIEALLESFLGRLGFERRSKLVEPVTPPQLTPTCENRLNHMKSLGFNPRVIFDCGAFIGRWTAAVGRIFSEAHFVLIEPNSEILIEIKKNTASFSERVSVIQAALSDKPGRGTLNIWENPKHQNLTTALAASSLLDHVQGKPTKAITVDLFTLDALADRHASYPDLLKLDLQGGEMAALRGAERVLEKAELCITEFGCLDAYINRTTPRDLMEIMYDNHFCLYDVVDLRYRPYDGALTGGDLFFIKRESNLRAHKDYF